MCPPAMISNYYKINKKYIILKEDVRVQQDTFYVKGIKLHSANDEATGNNLKKKSVFHCMQGRNWHGQEAPSNSIERTSR